MSFQAYLDTIRAQTGKGPDDFRALAAERGLVGPGIRAGEVIAWLAADFGLGRGHAMAIFSLLKAEGAPRVGRDERIDKVFAGARAVWRPVFHQILEAAQAFGDDVAAAPTDSYVSLTRGGKKFAILQPAAGCLDVGVKRKGVAPTPRFAEAGAWNAMVTHRVRLAAATEADAELMAWIRAAWEAAK